MLTGPRLPVRRRLACALSDINTPRTQAPRPPKLNYLVSGGLVPRRRHPSPRPTAAGAAFPRFTLAVPTGPPRAVGAGVGARLGLPCCGRDEDEGTSASSPLLWTPGSFLGALIF